MIAHQRLSAYRIMWLYVFFDLPTATKTDRKNYASFRKRIQKDGFTMVQFSVYARHCASSESADVHKKRVRKIIPPRGQVSMFTITDKQYEQMENFWGGQLKKPPATPHQLEMF